MNVFEYLGLPADHRKPAKVTQLVKHFDEVPVSRKANANLGVQVKKDGVCALAVVGCDGVAIFSRSGKRFTNLEILEQRINLLQLNDGVYLGEVCNPDCSLEVLSGLVNPNRKEQLDTPQQVLANDASLHLFDLVTVGAFIRGTSAMTYRERHQYLTEYTPVTPFLTVLKYVAVESKEEVERWARVCIDAGEEGIVVINLDADWEAGHKGWRKMKKVRGVDYDLECIGYEEGTGKYEGKVVNLIFNWKGGKTIKAMLGKGWSHADAKYMYATIHQMQEYHNAINPIGKIFQVYALQESSKGKLRLPKVGELRHDKDESDV